MLNVLTVICCILAAYIIYCSGAGAVGTASLICRDAYVCPSDYLPVQTCGRRMILVNDICRFLSACIMLLYGVNILSGGGCDFFPVTEPGLATATALLFIASLAAAITGSVKEFSSIKEGIMAQWKKEKRISARHDDEVRLYRILDEAAAIPARNARMMAYFACMYGISLIS